jgi:hypothetical protein
MARVDGKPRMVSERYLGSMEEILAALDGQAAASSPQRTRHLASGEVAAARAVPERLDLASIVDDVVGSRRSDAGAGIGTYLALVVHNRVVEPSSNHPRRLDPRRATQ